MSGEGRYLLDTNAIGETRSGFLLRAALEFIARRRAA